MAWFNNEGISFQYPENWRLEREDNEDGWSVSVQSPGTAFLTVYVREDMPAPAELADTALDALRDVYKQLDVEDCVDTVAGQPAIGHLIRFFSLDLTNTCWTRSFYCAAGTVLVMWQANDLELEQREPVLKAICASLAVAED
jgi:hypothetical protein